MTKQGELGYIKYNETSAFLLSEGIYWFGVSVLFDSFKHGTLPLEVS